MSVLKGNLMFGQSGGPTSVINASAAGVFIEALKHSDVIDKVYGAHHGIVGVLTEDFYVMNEEDPKELELLKYTPSSALGSVRYKLANVEDDESDYKRLLEVFRKYNIRYFFYNGGNDSMDTANKISKYMRDSGWEMRVMGVPKTIDNDLFGTDHSPGYASAAKYLATSTMEVYRDAVVYNNVQITILEVMGRNAGWLTAATSLANHIDGTGPDLIYLPEVEFDMDKFIKDVDDALDKDNKVIIAVSEGVHTADGLSIPELVGDIEYDSFGHKQYGGTGEVLAKQLKDKFNCKIRAVEFSLLQRAAAHLASQTDIDESFNSGAEAVKAAINGETDKMVGVRRKDGEEYEVEYILIPLADVANAESVFPAEWITENGTNVSEEFVNYALPLIQGETQLPKEHGLPRFARLKKVQGGY